MAKTANLSDTETYTHHETVSFAALGRPNTNPPTIVDKDNDNLLAFTVNTDHITIRKRVPGNYHSGPIGFRVLWTNDGGVDDNGKNVKWQMSYQTTAEGDSLAGNHANSPKTVEDTYVGAAGWVEHFTGWMEMAAADFAGKTHIQTKFMAVTAPATVLSCEPHMICVCWRYLAKRRTS